MLWLSAFEKFKNTKFNRKTNFKKINLNKSLIDLGVYDDKNGKIKTLKLNMSQGLEFFY